MKKFAVGFINLFENNVIVRVVVASDWVTALDTAFPGYGEQVSGCVSIQDAKRAAFDGEWQFDVTEIE